MLFYCGCKPDVHLSGDDTVLCEVDLGLSVKWANMNLGAEKPEEFGKYYALGDVQPYDSVPNTIDLPVNDFEWHDSLGVVFPNYDAASYSTDNKWRIPTVEEWIELGEKCKWRWVSYKGVEGYHIEGPNGNSIFLPAAGDTESKYGDDLNGAYRSSFVWDGGATYNVYFTKPTNSTPTTITLDVDLDGNGNVYFGSYGCHVPISVRPVKVKDK
jgi:hypothetical protein